MVHIVECSGRVLTTRSHTALTPVPTRQIVVRYLVLACMHESVDTILAFILTPSDVSAFPNPDEACRSASDVHRVTER